MLLFVILSLGLALVSSQVTFINSDRGKMWQDFCQSNRKVYNCEASTQTAKQNFLANVETVDKHNVGFAAGNVPYQMALYEFSDLTHDEVLKALCRTELPRTTRALVQSTLTDKQAAALFPAGPKSLDLRSSCLPVVNQKGCGSCWSFAAIAQVECLYKKRMPAWSIPFSQQSIIDCSEGGCGGGWPKKALDYMNTNGVVPEAYYPYKAVQAACAPASRLVVFPLIQNTYEYMINGSEQSLKNILAKDGPIVVVFYVTKSFSLYKSGVFEDVACPKDCHRVNHAMLLVGYGTDNTFKPPKDYWLVRNSWGDKWGDAGHVKVIRNKGASCNTACYAMYSK